MNRKKKKTREKRRNAPRVGVFVQFSAMSNNIAIAASAELFFTNAVGDRLRPRTVSRAANVKARRTVVAGTPRDTKKTFVGTCCPLVIYRLVIYRLVICRLVICRLVICRLVIESVLAF